MIYYSIIIIRLVIKMLKYFKLAPEQGSRPGTPNLEIVYEQPGGDSIFSLLLNLGQYQNHQELAPLIMVYNW